jgi:YggT family protein
MNLIVDIARILLNVVWWIIIVQAILSWLIAFNVINTYNDMVRMIWEALHKIMPDFGALDLSPMVVLLGLIIVDRVLLEIPV